MSDCGDVWSANAERLPRRFGIAVPDAGYVPNRVADLENANALLKLDVIRLSAELAECRAAMHEAGLTFVDDGAPQRDPIFDALGQQYRGGIRALGDQFSVAEHYRIMGTPF